jgi:hypothetical protein
MPFSRRFTLKAALGLPLVLSLAPSATLAGTWPRGLPRWRGFNLLNKMHAADHQEFDEWDFDFIARNGFNFVRLPMH